MIKSKWYNTPECREIAKAEASKVQGTQFDMGVTAVILSIVTSAVGTALYELIKKPFKDKHRDIEFVQIDQPDGTQIIAVKIKEG